MHHHERGFSLVEGLISVLVLSIGMLGLAQLQARLWKSAGHMRTTSAAYLASENMLERSLAPAALALAPGSEIRVASANAAIFLHLEIQTRGLLDTIAVSSEWEGPDEGSTTRLESMVTRSDPLDAKWFMQPP